MITYPLSFTANCQASSGIASPWEAQASGKKVTCAIPVEFEGPGGGFSPEDLYVLAVSNCFVATFKVIAEKSKLEFKSLSVEARLTVDRDERGHPWMKACDLQVSIESTQNDRERVLRLLTKASESCLVANSIKTKVSFEFNVN